MSSSHSNGHFPMNLPILTGKNYDNWCKQMKVVFCYQDMWNLVTEGMSTIGANATDEEKAAHKELKKRDFKALFIIHQCVDPDNFEKVGDCESAKEAWDILAQSFGGGEKVKEVKLQTFKRQYELLQMEESESIGDYFTKVTRLVNQIEKWVVRIQESFGFWRVLETVQRSIQEEEDSASRKKSEKRVNFQRSSSTKSAKETTKDSNKAHNGAKEKRCLAKRKVNCLQQWYHAEHNTRREILEREIHMKVVEGVLTPKGDQENVLVLKSLDDEVFLDVEATKV
ncbi:hypothetical protein QL285_090104 [Trifolium repens]|nr:hypothetical protein QL285_090100 [Trifolium repens]KAK2365333.1 hypothetical protein QL285_090102 [Trifolium repens]KAK2365334.1 hypothetical protein QL285_090103 [Trifolium repens]KAK2365335.1 hypothetical protein QL285_090104 [Trifolium repens]